MNKPTSFIAVLTDRYFPYQAEIVECIAAELNCAGYGILCITAKELQARNSVNKAHKTCNSIYSQADLYGAKGIIALSGTLGHGVDPNTVSQLLDNYNLPKVSFGLNLPTEPSVYFEERKGMHDLMHHLLDNKSRKRFAFIRGHHNDHYSQGREQIFRDALHARRHSESDIFYLEGNYNPFTTYQAVTDLLITNNNIDCIVAANDVMAASAARAAKARGLKIPIDIAISGFDDSSDSTQHSPALTTVRQPLRKMALDSVTLLLEQIGTKYNQLDLKRGEQGMPLVRTITSDSELVIRRSTNTLGPDLALSTSVNELSVARILQDAMSGLDTPDHISFQQISESLCRTLEHGSVDLLTMAAELHDNTIVLHAHWWLNLCDQIQLISEQLFDHKNDVAHIALVSSAMSKIKERIWSLEMDRKFEASRLENERSEMQLAMSSCNDLADILSATTGWLNKLKPARFFLVRYDDVGSVPSTTAQLIYSFTRSKSECLHAKHFQSSSVLPSCFTHELSSGLLVFSPVYSGELLFGYLLFDPSELNLLYIDEAAQCIGNAMRTHHHLTTLKTQKDRLQTVNAELEKLANFDALTGLANRLQFQQYLHSCTDTTRPVIEPFALLFIDLDGFKQVNDTLGHDIGDTLLLQVAQRLRELIATCIGFDGFISRLGGDEFTVILRQKNDVANIAAVSHQMLTMLSSPYAIVDHDVTISASIGCAFYPKDATDANTLVKRADIAMYSAKNNGKNRLAFFHSNMVSTNAASSTREQHQRHDDAQTNADKAA